MTSPKPEGPPVRLLNGYNDGEAVKDCLEQEPSAKRSHTHTLAPKLLGSTWRELHRVELRRYITNDSTFSTEL